MNNGKIIFDALTKKRKLATADLHENFKNSADCELNSQDFILRRKNNLQYKAGLC